MKNLAYIYDMNWDYIGSIVFLGVYYALIIALFLRILLENRNPLKTQSYLLLLALLPVIGLIIYFFFGVNYRKRKLFSRKALLDHEVVNAWMANYEQRLLDNRDLAEEMLGEKYKLPFLFFRNAKAMLTGRNRVKILNNGEEKFPALIADLRAAAHHIHLEYYIFVDDDIGTQIIDILCEKARQGVEVRLIYDAIGSVRLSNQALERLAEAGGQAGAYNPVLFTSLANRVNFRDHRKIAIIDGWIGYIGGINVSDHYLNTPGSKVYWRDTHCRIEGDAVHYLQLLFLLNWRFVARKLLTPTAQYFPNHEQPLEVAAAIVGGSPDSDSPSLMESFFSMITNARKEIFIATPYFIPNESILTAMKTSAKSGVRVVLLLPEESDTRFVHAASFTYFADLMENDIEVYLYRKGMMHSKVMIVDESVSTVGSTNMDFRSFYNNAEVNAFFFNEAIAQELKTYFMQDLCESRRITLKEWEARPALTKLLGSIARLIAPLL
jgi:cardiolipin synthase